MADEEVAAATMVDLFSNSMLPLFQLIIPCCNHLGKFPSHDQQVNQQQQSRTFYTTLYLILILI